MKKVFKNSLVVAFLLTSLVSFSKNSTIYIVKSNPVSITDNTENKIHVPTIRNQEEVVMISKIHFGAKPILVNIYYNDEVIFSEKINGNSDGVINRVYRLSKAEKGDYSIQINADDKKYKKDFSI